jgi:hypothetical protein
MLTWRHRYKAKNKDEPGLEQKVNDLSAFIQSAKFGMLTTRIADSGLLVSRCMALAAQVCHSHTLTPIYTPTPTPRAHSDADW